MPLTALIVDDEPLAREGLRLLLSSDREFGTIQEARSGREAVEVIRAQRPDIVFLDMQMPEGNGLSVVQQIGPEQMPAVIFITAHDQYAIHAFEINAIDYLLKPVTAARFEQSLQRYKARLQSHSVDSAHQQQLFHLLETIATPTRYMKRMAVRSAGKTVFVDVEEIDWIEAAENYVHLHVGRITHLLHVAISTLEKSLNPDQFLRVHRRLIVNTQRIKELQPATHGEFFITLHNGTRLQSSRMYNASMKALITNPF